MRPPLIVALAAWIAALVAVLNFIDPSMQGLALIVWAISALAMLLSYRRPKAKAALAQTFVSLALRKPTASPSVQSAFHNLPDYCLKLR